MANFTEGANSTNMTSQARFLPANVAGFFATLNIVLSITAFLGNALVLVALRSVSSIHPPTKLLFKNLATTDLSVGLLVQPLYATYILLDSVAKINLKIAGRVLEVQGIFGFIFCAVSIITPAAVSIDRLLALRSGLRYRQFVTLKRVRMVIAFIWLSSIKGFLLLNFLGPRITFAMVVLVMITTAVTSAFCFSKIFFTLRKRQNRVQDLRNGGGGTPLDTVRYKSTVSSLAWVQLGIVATYVPFIVAAIATQIEGFKGTNANLLWVSTISLIYFNSSMNPFLYCWKIREVRKAVKETVKRYCCFSV